MSLRETIFHNYLKEKELRLTEPRKLIYDVFLQSKSHLTIEELYEKVKQKDAKIGLATVYRTVKLLCEAGIARELQFSNEISKYEPLLEHEHHDHLICIRCGRHLEVVDPKIEELQNKLAQKNNFKILHHRLELYGLCSECADRKAPTSK